MKDHWGNFMEYMVKKYNLGDLKVSKCNITYEMTYHTRARRDPDNFAPKFINDGLVKGGLLVDDSFKQIQEMKFTGRYEKGVRKTRIIIEILESEGSL